MAKITGDKYIVVETPAGSGDIMAEEFDSLQAATEYLASSSNKAVLIKIENMAEETTVDLDWYT